MSNETTKRFSGQSMRIALGIGGILAVVVGVLILVWPDKTAIAIAGIIGVYAAIMGLVYVGLGIFTSGRSTWGRIWYIVLGALFVIAGVVALVNLQSVTDWLIRLIGVLVGILWIIEGIVALTTLRNKSAKMWTTIFAVLSLVAGIVLLFSPFYILAIWWLLGVLLAVQGAIQIIRASRMRGEA